MTHVPTSIDSRVDSPHEAPGSLTLATAEEPKSATGAKQITNSIGMSLTLVPSGEFMMGSKESAEATAAISREDYQAVLPGAVPLSFFSLSMNHRTSIHKPENLELGNQ